MAVLKPSTFLVFAVAASFARVHALAILGSPNHLHAVQGLYVKPSSDGTTGDLYVAATEDKAHWLAENPVNFLNQYAASLPDEAAISNQKRAIVTSPQIKYTYAMPMAGGSVANAVSQMLPYPVALPAETTEGVELQADAPANPATTQATTPATIPYYQHPYYQMYYSHMMSAFANALNNAAAAKEGSGEEGANIATATPQTAAWPYSYPVQYVMVDPAAWAKAQGAQASTAAQTTSTTETTTASASNESA